MGSEMQPRVCVVGAGVSGLCTCKHLLARGFDPVVLEATADIGGIWKSSAVATTKLQTPSPDYQYSDFPWPQGTPLYPTAQQVLDYLGSYAEHFGLLDKIKFNTKVIGVRKQSGDVDGNLGVWGQDKRPWEVTVQTTQDGEVMPYETLEFDFVVFCIGLFGDFPNIPAFPQGEGPEVFRGQAMHSLDYSKHQMGSMAGKRVVVVGFSKSAMDIAAEVASVNQTDSPCTMLFRNPHWIAKEWKLFGVPLSYLYRNRFAEMLVPKPGQGAVSAAFSKLLFPIRWAISKFCEVYLRYTFPLSKFGVIPRLSIWESIAACNIAVMPEGFFELAEEGRIKFCKSQNWHYYEKGVVVDGGKQVEADVVIAATGFQGHKKLYSLLPKECVEALQAAGGPMAMYRGLVHPDIPNLVLMGYQEDIANLRVSELAARWAAHLVDEKFTLPDAETMKKCGEPWVKHMKSSAYSDRACVFHVKIWHGDDLCRDMGWNPRRKQGWFQELFSAYSNMDYADHKDKDL